MTAEITQELKARGVAQVIVVVKQPPPAGAAAAAVPSGRAAAASAGPVASALAQYFVSSERSQDTALA
ncbi:MAG: hypothetical protein M3347_14530, partial [Armatimonadota bacterium]|nr:hypothetical protein [Armatimonadota bacterium]